MLQVYSIKPRRYQCVHGTTHIWFVFGVQSRTRQAIDTSPFLSSHSLYLCHSSGTTLNNAWTGELGRIIPTTASHTCRLYVILSHCYEYENTFVYLITFYILYLCMVNRVKFKLLSFQYENMSNPMKTKLVNTIIL